jgi:ribosomal protein S12 methylthiotransferase accessory factor
MDMEVYFPGNKKVYARYKGFTVETDQPIEEGGDNSAPTPSDLFLLSVGTCAGFYVLRFLQQRGLSTERAGVVLRREVDQTSHLTTKICLEIKLPPDFPQKYRDAVIRAAETCAVKRALENPPVFETSAVIG